MRSRISLVAVVLIAMLATASPAAGAVAPSVVGSDATWILSSQRVDGAIPNHSDGAAVWPYLSNFAAMGLARATEVTGDPRYAEGSWRWLLWYQAHQDASGFVTDYVVSGGVLTSTGDMDSTDAYAGTFLLAAWRTWKATGDTARLGQLRPGLAAAVSAIEATQDTDGLTGAKPSWMVKYLMDQAEAFAGLRAAVDMAGGLGDGTLAGRARTDANRMQTGVDALWNPATNAYDWAVHPSGVRQSTDWSVFYPDALQQAWAVAFGLTTGSRARSLMTQLDNTHPQWDQPTATETFASGPGPVGYWPVAGMAMSRVGQSARASLAADRIRSAAIGAGRAWPFTTGNAGQLIQLESADSAYLPPLSDPKPKGSRTSTASTTPDTVSQG